MVARTGTEARRSHSANYGVRRRPIAIPCRPTASWSGNEGTDGPSGGAGNDRLSGGENNDRFSGGSGTDTVDGGSGNDQVAAGPGNDRLAAGTGRDRLSGDRGNDRLNTRGRRCGDSANCGENRRDRDRAAINRGDRTDRGCERVSSGWRSRPKHAVCEDPPTSGPVRCGPRRFSLVRRCR